jgi:O-antigen ligase
MNSKIFDTIIEKGILFLIIFTPLAFGSVQEWASAVMELAAFIVLGAWLIKTWSGDAVTIRDRRLLLPAAALVLFVLFQLVPLPQEILGIIAPANAAIHQDFGLSGDTTWKTISIHPWATSRELLKVFAYLAVFFVIINHYREKEQIQRLIRSVIMMGVFLLIIAIAQKATWNGRVLWFYPVEAYQESIRNTRIWGPYINRNHFAGYLEMVIPLVLATSFYRAAKLGKGRSLPVLNKLSNAWASRRFPEVALYGLLGLVMTAVLFATLSRGGILGILVGLLVFFGLARSRGRLKKRADLFAMLGLALLLMLVVAAWSQIEGRFEELRDEQTLQRAWVWKDCLNIVKDFPFVGTGFGTFGDIYPKYQSHSSLVLYERAHNDYVEALTDLGSVGFLLVALPIVIYGRIIYRTWRERDRTYIKIMGAGGMAALAAMAVHSFLDFNLHVPANALLLVVVAGITYSIVFSRSDRGEESHA